MQGWRYRNEDAHVVSVNKGKKGNIHIFCVFDGHGGKEVSQFMKKHFTEELLLNKNFLCDDIKCALEETFLKMDELLQTEEGQFELKKYYSKSRGEDQRQDKEEKKKSLKNGKKFNDYYLLNNAFNLKSEMYYDISMTTGCTACVLVIDESDNKMYFANSGDSRAVLYKNNVAYQMTLDHKPNLFLEKNRIYSSEGWVYNGRILANLNLSRSLGDLKYKRIEQLPNEKQIITAFPDVNIEILDSSCQFVVLGCDGIWDCLNNSQACLLIHKGLKKNKKLVTIVEDIMESIITNNIHKDDGLGKDNMTCILVQFK